MTSLVGSKLKELETSKGEVAKKKVTFGDFDFVL